jgi:hypothetical protein
MLTSSLLTRLLEFMLYWRAIMPICSVLTWLHACMQVGFCKICGQACMLSCQHVDSLSCIFRSTYVHASLYKTYVLTCMHADSYFHASVYVCRLTFTLTWMHASLLSCICPCMQTYFHACVHECRLAAMHACSLEWMIDKMFTFLRPWFPRKRATPYTEPCVEMK